MYLDAGLDGGGLGGAEELADEDEAVLGPALAQRWTLVNKTEGAVLGPHLAGEHGIRSGFEGGQYFRTEDGVYHYFATEMVNDGSEMWVGTRGGHWTATDPSVPDVAAKKAGCTTTRQPCPGHQGRVP